MKYKNTCIFFSFILIILCLTGCKLQKNNEDDLLKQKADDSIQYLDTSIISLLNKLNNITFENFYVTTEKITLNNKSSSNTNAESDSSNKSNEEGGENSSGSKNNQETKINVSNMKSHNILLEDRNNINWDRLKSDAENLYSSWDSIIIDLYKLGINNEDILKFSSYLDEALINIKQEKKENTLVILANLYNLLPVFRDSYSEDKTRVNIGWTKAHIVSAYSGVGNRNWNVVLTEIANAENAYNSVISDAEFVNKAPYNSNKTYVCLKELQNSVGLQDEDIFYIKYKKFMEEVSLL